MQFEGYIWGLNEGGNRLHGVEAGRPFSHPRGSSARLFIRGGKG
jgi:hypothetical protein